jgi:hypothetical protein
LKQEEVRKLRLGLYRIYWKSGGTSVAAVGMVENGNRWLAPTNWTHPTEDKKTWASVSRVVLIATQNTPIIKVSESVLVIGLEGESV